MNFREALKLLYKGSRLTLPEWEGYWFVENGLIKVHTKDGQDLDTPFFKEYCDRTDWKIWVKPKIKPTSENVEDVVRNIIFNKTCFDSPSEVRMDVNHLEEGNIDSLDFVEIIMDIESEYKIQIPDEIAETFKTPNQIVSYLRERGIGG